MKSKNILGEIKSKSIKEAKNEINRILDKLEKNRNKNLHPPTDSFLKIRNMRKNYVHHKKRAKILQEQLLISHKKEKRILSYQ